VGLRQALAENAALAGELAELHGTWRLRVMCNPKPSKIGVQAAAGRRPALAANAALAGELAELRGPLALECDAQP